MKFQAGMSELTRQAARLQRKVDLARIELNTREISAETAGGKVTATVSYGRQVRRVTVDPAFLEAEGLELTLDAVCVAVTQAIAEADKAMQKELEKTTGGIKLPNIA
jgi:DNA-binding protein YbaB